MSDISLSGLAGFVVMVGTFLVALVAALAGGLIAWFTSKRRNAPSRPLVSRTVAGPAAMAVASLVALGWGMGRGAAFDEASPYLAAASLAVGLGVALLVVVRSKRKRLPLS